MAVFLLLNGLPSVNTTTMDFALLRPELNSFLARIKANDVRVLPLGQVSFPIWVWTAAMSLVKCVTDLILHTVS
jgi:hypothetical protein